MGQNQTKNCIILGHTGSGKSSLTAALLKTTGKEVARTRLKSYTTSAAFTTKYHDTTLVIMDTPGNANFAYDSQLAAHIGDNAILTICADEAHSFQTEKAAQLIQRSTMPSLIFINKMDVEAADLPATIAAIKKNILLDPALIYLPMGSGEDFHGVIDVIQEKALYFTNEEDSLREDVIPPQFQEQAFLQLQKLMEQVAETDDDLIEEFLEEGELDLPDLITGLRQAVASCALTPIIPGSVKKGLGLTILLEMMTNLFPASPSAEDPLQAQIFRLDNNPDYGSLLYCKVHQGTLDHEVYNISRHCAEKVKKIFIADGDNLIETSRLYPGMIGALSGLKSSGPGDTICADEEGQARPELPRPGRPTVTYAVTNPEADQETMFTAMAMAIAEDPALHLEHQPLTGETLLSGQGSYHLETTCRKIEDKFGLKISLTLPKVPYKASEQSSDHSPKLLEPIMNLTITLPVDSVGLVVKDLNDRRAKIMELKTEHGSEIIISHVPMAEILEYGADLSRLTEGRGIFNAAFSHYEQLPAELAPTVSN